MRALRLPFCPAPALLLLVLWGLLGASVLSICPTVCHCSRGHRVGDCSSRGLTKLPPGLQHNIRFLNLSFNSLQFLDNQLSHYAHLRTLDLSYNRLESLPPALPRSLWDIRAAGNHLRTLDKNDTAYHWNLKILDLSNNELERIVFINNTLPSLQALNLSYNRFWTVPTNMPHNLESIDLSHNFLVQILPGSLDRLTRLTRFYLHGNRFLWLKEGIFDKLSTLEVITLGDNPWVCEEEDNMTKLVKWAEQTHATVFGCPCYTKPICGRSHLVTTNGDWHAGLFTEPPFWVESRVSDSRETQQRTASVTTGYRAKSAMFESGNESMEVLEWASMAFSTQTSTTPRLKTTTKKIRNSQNCGNRLKIQRGTVLLILTTVYCLTTGQSFSTGQP